MKRVFTTRQNLQPGTYEIMVQLPRSLVESRKNIELNVGSEVALDFELRVEGSTESV